MYFSITSDTDTQLSYRLYKHPNTIYERTENNRRFLGKWNKNVFSISTFVDEQPILQMLKDINKFSYVTDIPYSVSPYTLSIDYVLRDAIRGKLPDGISATKHHYFSRMLPLTTQLNVDLFAKLGINVVMLSCLGRTRTIETYTYSYELSTIEPMFLHEFLQKIYVLTNAVTRSNELLSNLTKDTIDKYIKLSGEWIDQLTEIEQQKLFKQLSGYSKSLMNHINDNTDISITKIPSTHEQRHAIIQQEIEQIAIKLSGIDISVVGNYADFGPLNIIDLGASTGQLWQNDKINNITLVEIDSYKIDKLKFKYGRSKNVTIIHDNLLDFQSLSESMIDCDVVVLSEVIEHFIESDRQKIYDLVINKIQPKYIIISTPNREYNVNYGLKDGEFRHIDHKVEFNTLEFVHELQINNLLDKYHSSYHSLRGENGEIISFIGIFGRFAPVVPVKIKPKQPQTFILPSSFYRITDNQINDGRLNKVNLTNGNDLFYLGPTIAPVEWNEKYADVMEHPLSAIQYYFDRGIDELVVEKKYMGSRAYILYFKNKNIANKFGFDKTLIINSRSGFQFFDDDISQHTTVLKEIEDDLLTTNAEVLMLDCEILPWSIKSKNLAVKQFLQPGYAKFLHESWTSTLPLDYHTDKYIELVEHYLEEKPITIQPFNILVLDDQYMLNYNKDEINTAINSLFYNSKVFKQLDWRVYLNHHTEIYKYNEYLMDYWENEIIKYDNEGIVVKPNKQISYTGTGFPIVPALKVRQPNYLMLTYGIDYLTNIELLRNRNVSKKRLQSIYEFELSQLMVKAFLGNKQMTKTFVNAFIGIENAARSYLDATL